MINQNEQVECAVIQEFIALQNQRLVKAVKNAQIVIWLSQVLCFGIGVLLGALVF